MGGLSVSRVLADYFNEAVILDRDELGDPLHQVSEFPRHALDRGRNRCLEANHSFPWSMAAPTGEESPPTWINLPRRLYSCSCLASGQSPRCHPLEVLPGAS